MSIHCLFTLNHETLKRLNYRWSLAAIRRHEKRITFLIILLDTVSQPLFPDADTWIYSHAATQCHAQGVTKPGFYCAKCGYIYVSEEANRKWRTYSMLKHLNYFEVSESWNGNVKRNGITLTQDSGEKVNLWYHDVSFDVISQHNKIMFLFRPEQTHGSNNAHLIQIERYKTKHFMKRAVKSNAIFLLIILAKIETGSHLQRSMLLPHGHIRPGWNAHELWSRWPL